MRLKISLVLVAILLSWACNSSHSPLAPSETPNEHFVDPAPVVPTGSSNPTFGNSADEPGGCEVVSIERKGIRTRIDGLTLYIFVPASSTFGLNPYVDVWTENVNETKLGRGQANEEFSVELPEYKTYKIQLAVEVKTGENRIFQCDRHRFQVTPTASPPPPECIPEVDRYQEVTEGEFGECVPLEGEWGSGERTRYDEVFIYESNSCEDEDKLIESFEQKVTEECYIEPPCEVVNPPAFNNFSFNAPVDECPEGYHKENGIFGPYCKKDNGFGFKELGTYRSNPISGDISVANAGAFTFELKATSKLSEYEADDPDYVKNTDSVELSCGQSDTLSTTYNWKGHGSRYWYWTLTGPGIDFKSPVVDGGN